MLYGFGLLMVRFRWAVIAFWVVVLLLALAFAPRASSVLKGGFGRADTESERGVQLMQQRLGVPPASLTVVFSSDRLKATDPPFIQAMEAALAPLRQAPEVSRTITHYSDGNPRMVSPDGHTTYALVLLKSDIDTAMDRYPSLRSLVNSDVLQVWVTGGIAIFSDLNKVSERDLRRAETITFPLVIIALLLVFGSAVAAGLPVAIGAISVAVTLALIYAVAQWTDMSIFVLNVVTMLGLGIAIDYSLLMVSRFREELPHRPRAEAVAVSVATAGRALVFSGVTTILGLSGLLLFKFMMLRSMGIGGVLVVGISLMAALTLLPAILGALGPRVNALRIIPVRESQESWWRRVATVVMRHPVVVMVLVGVFLLALGIPFLRVKMGSPWASILPAKAEARQGWEVLASRFGEGELSPLLVVVTAQSSILNRQAVGTLYDFTHRLAQDPRVARVEGITTLDPRLSRDQYALLYSNPTEIPFPELKRGLGELAKGDTTLVRVYSKTPPLADETKALVKDIRATAPRGDLQFYITGTTADLMDAVEVMYRDFPKIIIYIVITIYIALLFLFRSVLLPLKAVIMNTLSIFASYGALVFIFQQGHFQGLLGFQAEGFTEASVPIIMFCILYGLSMDYEVFLLSRVKEIYDTTKDNTASVALGLERTGRIITSAALILVLVMGAFVTGDIVLVKALGLGMALAIFLDATIVRALLVPATMRILGDLNWWAPRWLKGRAPPVIQEAGK
ncbi:MAG: MMPL family transporter [Chloroflexi bacterium]|nr:MMPL family transporter [Chloroflexota bacterium]